MEQRGQATHDKRRLTRRLPPWSGPGAAPRGSACFPSCRCRCRVWEGMAWVGWVRSGMQCGVCGWSTRGMTMMMMMLRLAALVVLVARDWQEVSTTGKKAQHNTQGACVQLLALLVVLSLFVIMGVALSTVKWETQKTQSLAHTTPRRTSSHASTHEHFRRTLIRTQHINTRRLLHVHKHGVEGYGYAALQNSAWLCTSCF